MSGEQGECVVCGDLFTLRKDGTVRKHDERRNLNPQWRAIESAQRIGRLYRRVAVRSGAVDELELFSP